MKKLIIVLVAVLSLPLVLARPAASPAAPVTAREQLNATLWLHWATEYELSTLPV